MKKRVNPWLIMELADPCSEQRVRDPLFGALELSSQFMGQVRRLYRLGRLHQLDHMQTQSLETSVFWDIPVNGQEVPDAISRMNICGEHISFGLEFFLFETINGLVWKSVGETFCTSLGELESYCEGRGQIHFLETMDLEEAEGGTFVGQVVSRMLELERWVEHEAQLHELNNEYQAGLLRR